MRLSNRKKEHTYQFISTAVVFFAIFSIALYFADKYELKILGWKAVMMMIVGLMFLLIYYLRGRQIFEYDSDGEALNFKNRSVMSFLGKEASDEFPKYKLLSYDVVDAIVFKRLYIHIVSKKSHSVTLKYDISYLSYKEIKDLKVSLNKVVKANKEKNH